MEIKYCGECIHNDDGVCDKVGYFVKDTDMCICKKSLTEDNMLVNIPINVNEKRC